MYEDIREEAEANRGKSKESRVKINLDTALDELGGATEKVSFNGGTNRSNVRRHRG